MKPTLQRKNLSAIERESAANFPLIQSNYHVAAMPNFHGGCARLSSFRNISSEYFRNEARGEFCLEFIAFAAIVVTAAIPLLSNAHALSDFLRAIGAL
jgi:hypothetical protein